MASFDKFAPLLLASEKGWSDDPDDRGGATMDGVTLETYRRWRKSRGNIFTTKEDLRRIARDEWTEIMKTLYWDKVKGDLLASQSVANIWADWAVNSGPSLAVREVQKLLGVTADGIAGTKTLRAANLAPSRLLFADIKTARTEFYRKRSNAWKYLRGWLNRLDRFEYVG